MEFFKTLKNAVTNAINVITEPSKASTQVAVQTKTNSVWENKKEVANENEVKATETVRSRQNVYSNKELVKICEEYRINPEDLKKAKLLETILGCSEAELLYKSEEEISQAITALKDALTRDFKLFFLDRDLEDVKEIAKDANKSLNRQLTGGSWLKEKWNNIFRDDSLVKELGINKNATPAEIKQAVGRYFKEIMGDMSNLSTKEKEQKYAEALQTFGELINTYADVEEKEILSSAIAELRASNRQVATRVLVGSCQNDRKVLEKVANSLDIEEITATIDELGEYCDRDDAIQISSSKYQHMNAQDLMQTLDNLGAKSKAFFSENSERLKEISEKVAKGESLTREELQLYVTAQNAYINNYAGGIVGTSCNVGLSQEQRCDAYGQMDRDMSAAGIDTDVYGQVNDYVSNYPDSVASCSGSVKDFEKQLNSATNGNYSRQVENFKSNGGVYTSSRSVKLNEAENYRVSNGSEQSDLADMKNSVALSQSFESIDGERKSHDETKQVSVKARNVQKQKEVNEVKILAKKEQVKAENEAVRKEEEIKQEAEKQEEKAIISDIAVASSKGRFEDYRKKHGDYKTVRDTFGKNYSKISSGDINSALYIYKNVLSDDQKRNALKQSGIGGFNKLFENTSTNVILSLKNDTLQTFSMTQKVKEKAQELVEDSNK